MGDHTGSSLPNLSGCPLHAEDETTEVGQLVLPRVLPPFFPRLIRPGGPGGPRVPRQPTEPWTPPSKPEKMHPDRTPYKGPARNPLNEPKKGKNSIFGGDGGDSIKDFLPDDYPYVVKKEGGCAIL